MNKKLFLLELNEFNINILKYYSKKYNLTNIQKILKFNKTDTYTNDRYIGDNNQFGYLDPWSQWVSVHTQTPSKVHKIKNLGDIPSLKLKQIWEKRKNDFYIWGPMNASKKNSKNVKVFFPDPWVYSEKAHPSKLNNILIPIKKITKSRGKLSNKKKLILIFKLIKNLKMYLSIKDLNNFFINLFKGYFKFGNKNLVQIIAWEDLSFRIFINFFKKKDNFFAIFFLNSLAHVQHHYWKKKNDSEEIIYCLKKIDTLIDYLLKIKNIELIIFNGLSQINVEDDKLYLYEQISHEKFLDSIGIKFKRIEKLMTNDAFVFFNTSKDKNRCAKLLDKVRFKSKKIFFVETQKDKKLFYKTNYIKKVSKYDKLTINKKKITFLKYFQLITLRRGIHSHNGEILSQKKYFPKRIPNHKFFNYI